MGKSGYGMRFCDFTVLRFFDCTIVRRQVSEPGGLVGWLLWTGTCCCIRIE